jgi:hypothetical protein
MVLDVREPLLAWANFLCPDEVVKEMEGCQALDQRCSAQYLHTRL